MAILNKSDSAQIFSLMEHKGWGVLTKLVAMTVNDLNARKAAGTNEFEVLRSLHIKEGRVDALKEFFNDVESGKVLSE